MKIHLIIAAVVWFLTYSTFSKEIEDDHPKFSLPKLFDIDDHKCSKIDSKFCKLSFTLNPTDTTSHIWKYVASTRNSTFKFDRSKLYRSTCLTQDEIGTYGTSLITELKYTNLSAEVNKIHCVSKSSLSSWDYIFFIVFGLYLLVQIIATYYDVLQRKHCGLADKHKLNPYLSTLSMVTNWEKAVLPKQNEDYKRLKCIQGIRIYNLILIVCVHIQLAWFGCNISSVDLVETVMESNTIKTILALNFFVVQTNFMISSWLLTNQINELYESRGYFSVKDGLILLINRYFRFLPVLLAIVLILRLNLIYTIIGPNNFVIMDMAFKGCQKNWLTTLLMINNIHEFGDTCHPATWYLSIDTQFYAVNILFLYLKFKLKWNSKVSFFLLFIASCLLYGLVIYNNNLNVLFQLNPEFLLHENIFYNMSFYLQYLSFYCSWSTSIIGMILGTVYFSMKHKEFDLPGLLKISSIVIFIAFPVLALRLSIVDLEFSPFLSAILGSMLKPIYSIGIGIGIIGMVFSKEGLLKKICEWKYAVLVSNFVFSTYLSHIIVVFTRLYSNNSLVTAIDLLSALVPDVVISLILGAIFTILIEQPGFTIQKMLLPQVKRLPAKYPDQNVINNNKNK